MSKRSIIFIAIAIIFVVVGFFSTDTSKETEIISNAIYVEEGKVLPENEGKIVIVPGKAEAKAPLVDELTGVEIPHIRANRTIEIYEETTETDEEGNTYYVMNWVETVQSGINQFNEPHSTSLVADCTVGEFDIDQQIIKNISTGKKLDDIEHTEIARRGYIEHYDYSNSITYLAQMDYMPESGEEKSYGWGVYSTAQYEGAHRVSYTIPMEESCEYTFIGRQKDGKITYDKELGMQAAFSGLQNPQQLAERVESGGMTGAIIAWVIAAVLLFLGILSGKKKASA